MVLRSGEYILRSKDGKAAKIRRRRSTTQLSAVEVQGGCKMEDGVKVHIHDRDGYERKQMTFCWMLDKTYYFPKVSDEKLELEQLSSNDENRLSDSHWFEKVNVGGGDYYFLQSVIQPHRYLFVKGKIFSISADSGTFITDEEAPTTD
ncbi:uncharacterized protein LOC124877492 isoform X1 [Lates japonicus]